MHSCKRPQRHHIRALHNPAVLHHRKIREKVFKIFFSISIFLLFLSFPFLPSNQLMHNFPSCSSFTVSYKYFPSLNQSTSENCFVTCEHLGGQERKNPVVSKRSREKKAQQHKKQFSVSLITICSV